MSPPSGAGGIAPAGPNDRRVRRAPRLRPEQRLAPYMTRHGRFRAINPGRGRPLPKLVKVLATLGWGVLVAESFRRAVSTVRAADQAAEQ